MCLTLPDVSVQLIEVQAEYHRKSFELLQSVLPQIKAHQGESENTTLTPVGLPVYLYKVYADAGQSTRVFL